MQKITLVARSSARSGRFSGLAIAGAMAAAAAASLPVVAQEEDVGEVIVTATRRDTTLRDAPVTISAFTEADIEARHIVKPADFLSQVWNVNLTTAVRPGESDVSMRGIQGNFGLTQPVAVVVDGVVAANPNALDQQLVGIQQIEVVKGPQSALYGRTPTPARSSSARSGPHSSLKVRCLRAQAMVAPPGRRLCSAARSSVKN